MAKDYSKMKALCQEMIKCIGDESEGGDGTDVKHTEEERGDQGETGIVDKFPPDKESSEEQPDDDGEGKRKKRKDDVKALLASTLASKFNK